MSLFNDQFPYIAKLWNPNLVHEVLCSIIPELELFLHSLQALCIDDFFCKSLILNILNLCSLTRLDFHCKRFESERFDSFLMTQGVSHHAVISRMITNFTLIVIQQLYPSLLSQVDPFLIKDVLKTFIVHIDDAFCFAKIVAPDLQTKTTNSNSKSWVV